MSDVAEKNCQDCEHCNIKAFHSGKWFCSSPEVSIFNLPVPIDKPCFTPRKKNQKK